MTLSFYEQHQSIALQLKTYWGTGEGETKCCAKCCLKVYMTQFFLMKEHQTLERLGLIIFYISSSSRVTIV